MSLRTGYNITSGDLKTILEKQDKQADGIRSWQKLFGNTSLSYSSSKDALSTDYSRIINEAYLNNMARENAILGVGLSTGSAKELVSANRADLRQAYETYITNYRKEQSLLDESYATAVSEIDTALTDRAQNFTDIYSNAYKYIEDELSGASNKNGELWNNNAFVRSLYDIKTETIDGNDVTTATLKPWSLASADFFDKEGNLTKKGQEFYDFTFNFLPEDYVNEEGKAIRSFDAWLSDTNPDLRNWWINPDIYNYTFEGSNVGTSKTIIGLDSTDQLYRRGDYGNFADVEAKAIGAEAEGSALSTKATEREENQERLDELGGKPGFFKRLFGGPQVLEAMARWRLAKKYDKSIVEDWTNYKTAMAKDNATLQTNFKKLVGADEYETFKSKNKALFDEFDRLSKVSSYNEKDYEAYVSAYQKMVKAMETYAKSYEGSKQKYGGY